MTAAMLSPEDVKFEVLNETTQARLSFSFELVNGLPIKIGDGSFGAVFAVVDGAGQPYALKIFYEVASQDREVVRTAHQRFKSEMNASAKIRAALPTGAISGLVLPIASTESFKNSSAGTKLKEYFQNINLSVSNFALVMERYDCTLKNLLEGKNKPHSKASVAAEKADAATNKLQSGYEVLKSLKRDEKREQFIAWIIHELIVGLKILHRANLRHHDIKPANILLRLDLAGRLHVALGDLGFLHPDWTADPNNGTLIQNNQDGLPLGTRHYRSVEQRDYFDVCEVDVDPSAEHQLSTSDPKFRDSLMEVGDVLIFSKDRGKSGSQMHEVEDISRTEGITKIKLKKNHTLKPDQRTQVNLYKKHTIRTDIFGIGALIYDMVTCGRSPERFYDFIRRWDRTIIKSGNGDATRSQQFGIFELEKEYNQRYFTKASGVSAEMSSVFDELRYDEKNYPSPKIANIIFKCMLGRASGSYVFGHVHEQRDGVEHIYADLEKDLAGLGPVDDMRVADKNPVWQRPDIDDSSAQDNANNFSKRLSAVRRIWDPKERLAQAYVFISPLCSMLLSAAKADHQGYNASSASAKDRKLSNEAPYPFYADMAPENLEENSDKDNMISVRVPIFKTGAEYMKALKDNSIGLITNSLRREYMPPYITGMVRSVHLQAMEKIEGNKLGDSEKSEKKCKVNVWYVDFSPVWFGLNNGDYLIYTLSGDTHVYEITDLNNISVPISVADSKAVLVKRLLPVEYYSAVLAIYIHDVFFVDFAKDFGEVPEAMQLLLKISSMSDGTKSSVGIIKDWQRASAQWIHGRVKSRLGLERIRQEESQQKAIEKAKENNWFDKPKHVYEVDGISHCYHSLACLYVWLTGLHFRRCAPDKSASDYVPQIEQYWDQLGRDIAMASGYPDGLAQMRTNVKMIQSSEKEWSKPEKESQIPSLNKLIGSLFL